MKDVFQSVMVFLFMGSIAFLAEADELNHTLSSHFENTPDITFLSYESIQQTHSDEYGAFRYLVMDFKTASASVQSDIHSICTTILKDVDLIRTLSDQGYDMISVSFDRHSQYDCL